MGSLDELEKYAKENNVPIIQKEGLNFLIKYIKENNIINILEIGTAIGYSAINMALINENIKVTTIERNEEMYNLAKINIRKFNLENRITIILSDALETEIKDTYDLIFIDAAKGQYTKFFEKYKNFLNPGGVIITDNLKFHGYVGESSKLDKGNLKSLVEKIEGYIAFLKNNEEFDTVFKDIGDGLSISTWKKDEK